MVSAPWSFFLGWGNPWPLVLSLRGRGAVRPVGSTQSPSQACSRGRGFPVRPVAGGGGILDYYKTPEGSSYCSIISLLLTSHLQDYRICRLMTLCPILTLLTFQESL